MLQSHALTARRHHDAGKMGQVGKHLRGGCDHLARIGRAQLLADLLMLNLFQRLDGQQGIDEQAVTLGRRHPSGRGMRAGDIAHFLQVGHHIAD